MSSQKLSTHSTECKSYELKIVTHTIQTIISQFTRSLSKLKNITKIPTHTRNIHCLEAKVIFCLQAKYVRLALSDINGSLKALNEKLDWIINRLNHLENVLIESQQYPEVVSFLQSLKLGTALYGEPLKTLNRLISARHLIESTAQKDEINKTILNYLALRGPKNISELTREMKRQRGKASRTTIRNRVKQLVESKALVKDGTRYRLP